MAYQLDVLSAVGVVSDQDSNNLTLRALPVGLAAAGNTLGQLELKGCLIAPVVLSLVITQHEEVGVPV